MSLGKSIAKNTLYLAFGKVVSTAIGVLALALLLRYLSPDDYGRYTTVLAFVLLFGTLSDFGLNLSTTQDISEPNRDVGRTLSAVFTGRLLVNLALLLLLPAVLWLFPYEPIVKRAIFLASALFVSTSLFQVLASYFQATLQAGKVALAEFAGRIILLATTLLAIALRFSFLEIMLTVVASAVAQLAFLVWFVSRKISLSFVVDWGIWRRIAAKTWPIALSVVFTTIYFKGDAVILSLARPYEDVGIYGAAYKILEVLITLPILFMGLVLPHLSAAYAEGGRDRFGIIMQKSWDAIVAGTLPLVAGTLVLAGPIIRLVAVGGYAPAAGVLRVLILATGIIFLGSLFTHAVVAVHRQRAMIKYYALAALVAILLYIRFIPTYSYYAAAWITVAAELGVAFAAALTVRRAAHFTLSFAVAMRAIAASMGMALVLLAVPNIPVLLLIPIGVATYGALALLLGIAPRKLWQRGS